MMTDDFHLRVAQFMMRDMWNYHTLSRIDFRVIPVIIALMGISLLIISAYTFSEGLDEGFFTVQVKAQLKGFLLGIVVFVIVAGFDYNKLREYTWILYLLMIVSLIGLFFTDPIQRVHRWYRIPLLNVAFQPSEYAKLVVVITLSWFLERRAQLASSWSTAFFGGMIAGIPFLLILKQPDLGTALVLFPITLVMFYFGDIKPQIVKLMAWMGGLILILVAFMFLGILGHDEVRPYAQLFLKDYQFDRLNPNTHHQKAAVTAIALGGILGKGWRNSDYTSGGWLPAPYTDSPFPAFGEEFGLLGLLLLLALFYALIYFSFQVTAVAADHFGRLLSAGVTVYLAMHVLLNTGMMSGLLPITGVPLILISYGGSSILSTMIALGILQSIYSRRFMF
jgi:rod shape determining protein RodA